MRGDLTVFKDGVAAGIIDGNRFVFEGNAIASTDRGGVARRDAEKSFRVSMNAATVEAVAKFAGEGENVPVRFKLTMRRHEGGGRVYIVVPAGDQPAQGMVRTRK